MCFGNDTMQLMHTHAHRIWEQEDSLSLSRGRATKLLCARRDLSTMVRNWFLCLFVACHILDDVISWSVGVQVTEEEDL